MDEAKNRLRNLLIIMRKEIQDANGAVKLGLLVHNPDGSGKIKLKFDADQFSADLETVLDVGPQTTEDNYKAAALRIVAAMRR
jgi:hypothetical protein